MCPDAGRGMVGLRVSWIFMKWSYRTCRGSAGGSSWVSRRMWTSSKHTSIHHVSPHGQLYCSGAGSSNAGSGSHSLYKKRGNIQYMHRPKDCRDRCWFLVCEADRWQDVMLVINPAVLLSARPTFTFPNSEHHCPRLIAVYAALWTEAHVCKQLVLHCYLWQWHGQKLNSRALEHWADAMHCITMPHCTLVWFILCPRLFSYAVTFSSMSLTVEVVIMKSSWDLRRNSCWQNVSLPRPDVIGMLLCYCRLAWAYVIVLCKVENRPIWSTFKRYQLTNTMNLYTSSSLAASRCHPVKLPSAFKAGLLALTFLIAKSVYD